MIILTARRRWFIKLIKMFVMNKQKKKDRFLLLLVFILAFCLRIYGLNWDQSQHLHPDERFMTMVVSAIKLPKSLKNYFSQKESSLNPYNHDFSFYVYGTFPLLVTKLAGEAVKYIGYDQIFLIGRIFSATLDSLTCVLVYLLFFLIFKNRLGALFSAFFYAIAVFPIQQSHFFTVDSFVVFFTTFSLWLNLLFLQRKNRLLFFLAGFSFGMALASKVSVIITSPVFIISAFLTVTFQRGKIFKNIWRLFFKIIIFFCGAILAFRLFQPYAFDGFFSVSNHFIQNISEARRMITGEMDYPPNIQWAYTKPLVHPLVNIFFWGFGPLATIFSLSGILVFFKRKYSFSKLVKDDRFMSGVLVLIYAAAIFFYQGIQLAKYMRYFYPVYPVLAIFSGLFIERVFLYRRKEVKFFVVFLLALSIIWPVSFLKIYALPHSRMIASGWIYKNIPAGAKITNEEWDDGLPLSVFGNDYDQYIHIPLGLYNTETEEKWRKVSREIAETDYIIMSSNRLFGSIPRLPRRYPVTSLFYKLLFDEKLGFKKVADITSRPCFLPFKPYFFCFNDDNSEESFTVYDHPRIVIFKKEDFKENLLEPLLNNDLINRTEDLNPNKTNFLF